MRACQQNERGPFCVPIGGPFWMPIDSLDRGLRRMDTKNAAKSAWNWAATWLRFCTCPNRRRTGRLTAERPLPKVGTAVLVEVWERWLRGQDLNL
jgi:hypothetical protein